MQLSSTSTAARQRSVEASIRHYRGKPRSSPGAGRVAGIDHSDRALTKVSKPLRSRVESPSRR